MSLWVLWSALQRRPYHIFFNTLLSKHAHGRHELFLNQPVYSTVKYIRSPILLETLLHPPGVTVSLTASCLLFRQSSMAPSQSTRGSHEVITLKELRKTVAWEEHLTSCMCDSLLSLSLATDWDTSFTIIGRTKMSHFIKSSTQCPTALWGNTEPDTSHRQCSSGTGLKDVMFWVWVKTLPQFMVKPSAARCDVSRSLSTSACWVNCVTSSSWWSALKQPSKWKTLQWG